MWNWQVALSVGASIYLYDGSPLTEIDILLNIVHETNLHYLEWAQKYLDHLKNENYNSKHLDLKNLKIFAQQAHHLSLRVLIMFKLYQKRCSFSFYQWWNGRSWMFVAGNLYDGVYAGEIKAQA